MAGNVAGWLDIGLLPDEAYYWVWSQRLQAGYFDHPPLVAWLMGPAVEWFGSHAWTARLPAVLSWLVGAVAGFALAGRIYGSRRAGWLAVLIWATLPGAQVAFHVVTPDAPLIIFTWLTYDLIQRALTRKSSSLWVVAGFFAGLAVTAKYTGVLVPFGILLALTLSTEGRCWLLRPQPWLAALASLAAFAPVVWWNWEHDWISFAFQFGHGVQTAVQENPWEMLTLFLAGQLALAMPWTWLAMAWAGLRGGAIPATQPAPVRHVLQVGFWLPLLFFGAAGLTAEGHPNWPLTAYLPGTVLLAGCLERWIWPRHRLEGGARRGVAALVGLAALSGVLLINLIRFPQWMAASGLDVPAQRTQLSQSYGWERVGEALREELAEVSAGEGCVVVGNRLQTASMLAWELGDVRRVTVPETTRFNQFHLWQADDGLAREQLCLYVEQFEAGDAVKPSADLGQWGRWQRTRVLELENPDGSRRRFGFYLPPKAAVSATTP